MTSPFGRGVLNDLSLWRARCITSNMHLIDAAHVILHFDRSLSASCRFLGTPTLPAMRHSLQAVAFPVYSEACKILLRIRLLRRCERPVDHLFHCPDFRIVRCESEILLKVQAHPVAVAE